MSTFNFGGYRLDQINTVTGEGISTGETLVLQSTWSAPQDAYQFSFQDLGFFADGDAAFDEVGDDFQQQLTVTDANGGTLANGQGYLEERITLIAPGGGTIDLYMVEVAGTPVGFISSGQILPGVHYEIAEISNVTVLDAPAYSSLHSADYDAELANALHAGSGDELLYGGDGDDDIDAGSGNNTIFAGTGNDVIDDIHGSLSSDNNLIYGEAGNDTIWAGAGNSTIFGGSGDDVLHGGKGGHFLDGGTGNDTIWGGTDADTVIAGADNDLVWSQAGHDYIEGGDGYDTIYAGAGSDTVLGQAGNDLIYGESGGGFLDGGRGDDTVYGGAHSDTIIGGEGNDLLSGGAGSDTFTVSDGSGCDTVLDFDLLDDDEDGYTNDQIDVSNLTDLFGGAIQTWDVAISDDGFGNALLTFPNGEEVVLKGLSPEVVSADGKLSAMGIPCFTAGTLIETPSGERPVETLKEGDCVISNDGAALPILWAGGRTINAAELRSNPSLLPIEIKAGAIGNQKALRLSPQHTVAIVDQGCNRLARAKHLAERGQGKFRVAKGVRKVSYHHLLLPFHTLVRANGAWVETLWPGPLALGALGPRARLEIALKQPTLIPALNGDCLVEEKYGPLVFPVLSKKDVLSQKTIVQWTRSGISRSSRESAATIMPQNKPRRRGRRMGNPPIFRRA